MTTSLRASRDQQVEKLDGDSQSAFVAGWQACLAELERRIGEFDEQGIRIECTRQYRQARHIASRTKHIIAVPIARPISHPAFRAGALWQFEQTMKVLRE